MNIENMFDKPDVKQLVHAFSLLDDEKDIQAFLTDICTPREICDLSQRLQVARYLDEGEPYVEVQARTGASSTTVSRVSMRSTASTVATAKSSLSWRTASRPRKKRIVQNRSPGAVFLCPQSAGALGSGCFVPKDGAAVAMCPLGRVGWMH